MPKKKTAEAMIEDLAGMIGKGFYETNGRIDALAKEMRDGFAAVNERLDRVEFHVGGQGRRIEVLEDRVLQIAKKIGLELR